MSRIDSGSDAYGYRAQHARRDSLAISTPAAPGAKSPARERARATEPLQAVSAHRLDGEASHDVSETLAAEVPVAMQYNARPHAVMMATPSNLDDFAFGFALTERIIASPSEIEDLEIVDLPNGLELRMTLAAGRDEALAARRRRIAGPAGCGLCGIESLDAATRPPPASGFPAVKSDTPM